MFATDPITGERRLVAPGRAARLGPRPIGCPFCPGNEHATPAESGRRERREGTPTDAAWSARAFPNLFPLVDTHEVLVPTPRHATSWRELTLPELEDGIALLLGRRRALLSPGRYVHTFVNDGTAAGASLPHVHAQLVAIDAGDATRRLVEGVRDPAHCALCDLLRHGELTVETGTHHRIVAHPVPRMGGSLLIVPCDHVADPALHIPELAALLHRALQAVPDEVDRNLWIVADETVAAHWYLELVPRTANLAGVELGLGIGVSAQAPGDTAESARERLGMHR